MKKTISLLFVALTSMVLSAQDMTLAMADCGTTKWGNPSVSGSVITFTQAWDDGIGWWIGGEDWSAYNAVELEFENFDGQVGLNVEYGTAETSTGLEQALSTAGTGKVRIALNDTKKSSVQKVFLQTSKMGKLTVKSCVVKGGTDPYEIKGKYEVPIVTEVGENCEKIFKDELLAHDEKDIVVITLNCLSAEKLTGYGIAKIVAMDDWNNSQYDFNNKIDGVGQSEYRLLISELISFAKKGGTDWHYGADSDAYGIIVNTYPAESEIVSIKCYSANPAGLNEVANTVKSVKVMENGRMYIMKNGVKYNALGAAVE